MGRRFTGVVVGAVVVAALAVAAASPAMGTPRAAAAVWHVEPTPNPSDAVHLVDVSCANAVDCMAVGNSAVTLSNETNVIFHFDGFSWQPMATFNPGPTVDNRLDGVSCTSPTACIAVGQLGGDQQVLILRWDGTSWTQMPLPDQGGDLQEVSCTSPTSCVAVGFDQTDTLVLSYDGATWTALASPSPGLSSWFDGVSCVPGVPGGWCQAVGLSIFPLDPTTDHRTDLAVTVADGVVTEESTPDPAGPDGSDELRSVSCGAVGDCTAAGDWSTDTTGGPLLLADQASSWTDVTVPAPSDPWAYGGELDAVSCPSASTCTAVGQYVAQAPGEEPNTFTFVVATDGTAWVQEGAPSPGSDQPQVDLGGSYLLGVSCAAAATCQAVGATTLGVDGSLVDQSLALGSAPPPTQGYWLAAADGGVFAFGTAGFDGSMGATPLTAPVVAMAATADGGGYWLAAADGGVFAFGDASFAGSMGATHLNAPVVATAPDPATGGYWLAAADGGVFAFDAPFDGSMGGSPLNAPVVGMAAAAHGAGYRLAAADGGVFCFGAAEFDGSAGDLVLNRPVTAVASAP